MFVVLTALTTLGGAVPASAQEIFCTVFGMAQGEFQGDHGGPGGDKAHQIPVLFLTEEITSPFDTATGHVTGKRQHKPITIIKELDASSPQFFKAAVNNETLRTVTCTFYRGFHSGTGTGGNARQYFQIVLTDATIIDYRDTGDGVNGAAHGDERERISLTYQKIDITDLDSGTTAEDRWFEPLAF
jgi:type VI secretion system secreted protein Hcp